MNIDYRSVERQVLQILKEIIFTPLLSVFRGKPKEKALVFNASDDWLREALRSGQIQYADGVFSGSFSAKISSAIKAMGGKMDTRSGTFRVPQSEVPGWVSAEAALYQTKARSRNDALLRKLDEIMKGVDEKISGKWVDASEPIAEVQVGLRDAAEALGVSPELSDAARKKVLDEYSENMKLYIRKFSKEQILELRRDIEKNSTEGYRSDRLVDRLQYRYSVSENKATFLARQETSLFMAKFRQERFKEAGVAKYRWSTSGDSRVRDSHKHLEGKVFFYDHPPIVDPDTGRRANPGEDFNCRCIDIPILAALPQEALTV